MTMYRVSLPRKTGLPSPKEGVRVVRDAADTGMGRR